jgi:hypothetical protein
VGWRAQFNLNFGRRFYTTGVGACAWWNAGAKIVTGPTDGAFIGAQALRQARTSVDGSTGVEARVVVTRTFLNLISDPPGCPIAGFVPRVVDNEIGDLASVRFAFSQGTGHKCQLLTCPSDVEGMLDWPTRSKVKVSQRLLVRGAMVAPVAGLS